MLNARFWMLLGGATLSVHCSDLTLDPQDAQSDALTAPDAGDAPTAPRMDATPAEASLDAAPEDIPSVMDQSVITDVSKSPDGTAGVDASPVADRPTETDALPGVDRPMAVDRPVAVDRPTGVDVPAPVDRPAPRVDRDGDGYFSDVDCNDGNFDVHPDAVDRCGDAVDQDCDGHAASCACAKPIHVLMDDYGTVNELTLAARSNGCWEVHSVNGARPPEFRHCIAGTNPAYDCGGHVRQTAGVNWYYDDTNTSHGATDLEVITQCATRCGTVRGGVGDGFITMAAGGGWRRVATPFDGTLYIAQLYTSASSEALQSGLVASWQSPRVYIPQVSFTHATTAQIGSWTAQVCAHLTRGNWMAFYVGSSRGGSLGAFGTEQYAALAGALNACTR